MPDNAKLDYTGHGWVCRRGFSKTQGMCLAVEVPKNGELDYTDHGWTCRKGFLRAGTGCQDVVLPKNATFDYTGHNWRCIKGYRRVGKQCTPMSSEELANQKALIEQVEAELEHRRAQGVSGDDCESEYKTNAEVCVEITDGDLSCNESYAGNYYSDCDVTLEFEVATDYEGGAYLDVNVECSVIVAYEGREMYFSSTDSQSDGENYYLYANGLEDGAVTFNFSFSGFNEVTSAKISSAECEVEDVNLW